MQDDQQDVKNTNQPVNRYSLLNTGMWLIGFYVVILLLGIIFGIYAQINGGIDDVVVWFTDGDVVSVFSLCMAISVGIVLFGAIEKEPNPLKYLGVSEDVSLKGFKPWLLAIAVYIAFWWVVNELFKIEMPDSMMAILNTTDYIWLSFISICIVAPIIEEAVFRGFLITRLRNSVLGKSGAIVVSSVLFTLLHTQYSGMILFELFTLSILLAVVRIKTNNLQYCILVHAINNTFSFIALYLFV